MAGFADKLRLTTTVLNCRSQKELQRKFLDVNPRTGFDPSRAYKWISGKSEPRDRSVYDDMSKILDLGCSGETLRTCSYDEFAAMVRERHQGGIVEAASVVSGGPAPDDPGLVSSVPSGHLDGDYAVYSMAWSPFKSGQMIRASARIEHNRHGEAILNYEEQLFSRDVRFSGPLERGPSTMYALTHDEDHEAIIFFCLGTPSIPSVVIGGVMAGEVLFHPDARPAGCRVLYVRSLSPSGHRSNLGYMAADQGSIASDLRQLGYRSEDCASLAEHVEGFVNPDQLPSVMTTGADFAERVTQPFFQAYMAASAEARSANIP